MAPMKSLARLSLAAGFASASLVTSLAAAHVRLVYPTPRYPSPMGMDDSSNIKEGPCGRTGDSRTTDMTRVTVLEPGATITVQFNETINHPGFFRISFDNDGQDAFVAPSMRSQVQTGPTFTLPVLLDNIADKSGGMYTAMVTLPNVECERCTLQLIQVMVNANIMSWDAGPDADIYFTCADIALRRASGGGGMGGMSGSGPGAGSGGVGGTGGAAGGIGGTGGMTSGGVGGVATGGTAGFATGGTATGGVATGGTATGGVATGGGGGSPATGGSPTGGGAPAGGTSTAGTTSAPTDSPPDEEGGCRVAPTSRGGHVFLAAAVAALAVFVRRRRGSRSFAA
jgi:MYXO-CTERM domain-containing protein